MTNKITTAEFVNRSNEKHGGFYDYSLVNYARYNDKVVIMCPEHGTFEQTAGSHLEGYGCFDCGKNKKRKKFNSLSDFINAAEKIHGKRYDYSKVTTVKMVDKITIICSKHGSFRQIVEVHLKGSGCRHCGLNIKSFEQFLVEANAKHDNKYDYSSIDLWTTVNAKIKIICPFHGEFEQIANVHLNSNGCYICADILRTTDDFIRKSKRLHGTIFGYNETKYQHIYNMSVSW